VSDIRAQLAAQLRRFDEEAFVALANRGLLRRAQKDLEKQPPVLVEEAADSLTMSVGEHHVRMDARGPGHAQCSCPAGGICQHVLTAALALQSAEPVAGPAAAPQATAVEPAPDATADSVAHLHEALLGFGSADLLRHAGKTAYRWAWQFVQDMDSEQDLRIDGGRNIAIGFRQPRLTFRYMGGGIESLLGDLSIAQIEKYRVAAIIAYQRAHGVEPTPPESSAPRNAALDLGKDHALADTAAGSQESSRLRLRQSTRQLLGECISLGLSHLSSGIQERYATLSVWAQGAEYYRLALLLRRLADHVELLLERAGNADEHRLLDEMALGFALVSALDTAAARGAAPAHLVGRARSRYDEIGSLQLIGLGAVPWRSASGYVGLTLLFWSPSEEGFLSCTDARPEVQRGFNPLARYKAAGPWSGLGAPAQATGRRLVLGNAQLNAQGRLSAADKTSATVQDFVPAAELTQLLNPCARWSELLEQQSLARRSLLAEAQLMKEWVVLRPARFSTARFDPARQVMIWPLLDDEGETLDAEVPYSGFTSHLIERLEQIPDGQLPAGTLLVARMRNGAAGFIAEPLSLIHPAPGGSAAVDALHFDSAPAQGIASKLLSRLKRRTGSAEAPALTVLPEALRELRHWMHQVADRGFAEQLAEEVSRDLAIRSGRAKAAGFTAFSAESLSPAQLAPRLLGMHYVCLQYEHLLDGSQTPAN